MKIIGLGKVAINEFINSKGFSQLECLPNGVLNETALKSIGMDYLIVTYTDMSTISSLMTLFSAIVGDNRVPVDLVMITVDQLNMIRKITNH